MTSLAEILDAWATAQPRQFVIVYGPHRQPPYLIKPPTWSWIECQWCGKHIGDIQARTVNFYWYRDESPMPADPNFFAELKETIRKVHRCVDDPYVE